MFVPGVLLVCGSLAIGVAFIVRYSGRPHPKSPGHNSGLLFLGFVGLGTASCWTIPDPSRPSTTGAAVALSLMLVAAVILWQVLDRPAQRAARGQASLTGPELIGGDGLR